jgi:hypothetical protein
LRWRTFSSLSTPTMRKSPYDRAASRYIEWPSCRMSNVPSSARPGGQHPQRVDDLVMRR